MEQKIRVKTNDDEFIDIDIAIAMRSKFIKMLLENGGGDEVIHLKKISSDMVYKIVEFLEYHENDTSYNEDSEVYRLSRWDKAFLNVGQSGLFRLILAADYLKINSLTKIATNMMVKLTMKESADNIKRIFILIDHD